MTPELAVILALSLTGLFILLLAYERSRGIRHGRIIRTALDSLIENSATSLKELFPRMNRRFIRQLFHYVVHQALAILLWVTTQIETGLRAISRLNRRKAREEKTRVPDTHLREIAQHREDTALSEQERKDMKDDALRGGPPR